MPAGGTRVHNVEIFAGTSIGLVKPFVAKRWNGLFQRAVDGLVGATTGTGRGQLT
jgi:hypothetical protein